MDIKQRILMFTKHLGITIKEFEQKCGMSNGYVSSIRKGLGVEKLNNVLSAYPELNREWLLYGEGTMLKIDATASSFQSAEEKAMIEDIRKATADLEEEIERLKKQIASKDETIDVLTKALGRAQNDNTL